MSPTLLSKRLKELTEAGVITARREPRSGVVEYRLTKAGEDLRGIITSLGIWGQRWVEASVSLKNLDPSLLMWDMHRSLTVELFPPRRCTVKFTFPELRSPRNSWWLIVENSLVDVCEVDPGYEVNLYVVASLRSMTSVWMGHSSLKAEIADGKIELTGDKAIARSMHSWLGLSAFAPEKSRVAS